MSRAQVEVASLLSVEAIVQHGSFLESSVESLEPLRSPACSRGWAVKFASSLTQSRAVGAVAPHRESLTQVILVAKKQV